MSESKHTPGPWLVTKYLTVYALTPYLGKCRPGMPAEVNRFSAQLQGGNSESAPVEEMTANAHLIAAAPDMYDFIKAIRDSTTCICHLNAITGTDVPCTQCIADKLLAKAEGRDAEGR